MRLIRLAVEQPVTVIVGVVLMLLAGAVALSRLPIALTPNVDSSIVTISTTWEGASPEEIEQNIVDAQEERLLGLGNLRLMTSTSVQGAGTIRLEFETGTDINVALREVTQRLNEVAAYPAGVDEPVVRDRDPENRDYISWIVFGTTDPDFDIRTLRDFATDRIEPSLENVPGIAEINVLGGREREVQIRVDPVRLAQFGVAPTRLRQVIATANQNVSAGEVPDGKLDVRVRTIGQYASLEEVGRTVLVHGPGGPVLLRDVAHVVDTYKEANSFVRSRAAPVIAINADRKQGTNVIAVMQALRGEVDRLNAPGGMLDVEARRLGLSGRLVLTMVYDQTVYINDALGLVRSNLWIGGSLAVIVLLLFLRSLPAVGVLALSIPISIVGAVVAMVALGRSMNVVSLAGMAFAVGMVVDNAIVVLENIYRHLERGSSARKAALDGAREVWGAVLASTLTTIAVFVPILLIQEEVGQLFRDIALSICAALALSLLVSVTVVPCAAARMVRRGATVRAQRHVVSEWLGRVVYALCGSVAARLAIVFVFTGVAIAGTILLRPPADYLPKGNRNLVFGLIIPPPGYNIGQFRDMAGRIEEVIRPFWEAGELIDDPVAYRAAVARLPALDTFDAHTGRPGPTLVPPSLQNYFVVQFENILFHGGVSDDPRRVVDLLPLFNHATRPEILPGVFAFPLQVPLFALGGSSGSAVRVQLSGGDMDELSGCALPLFLALSRNPLMASVQPVPSNFALAGPEIHVVPDLVRLSELSLTLDDVALAVRMMGDGAVIDDYHVGGETVDLKLLADGAAQRTSLPDLEDVPMAAPGGAVVPLGSLARVQRVGRPQEITRAGRRRTITLDASAAAGVPLAEAVRAIEEEVEAQRRAGVIPPGVGVNLAGSASRLREVAAVLLGDGTLAGTLGSSMVLALLVCYLLMCVLFQSFLRPLVIMFSVPLATLGGFLALAAVHSWSLRDRYLPVQMLDVLTMLGFVILVGVVVNNAILIVHQAINFMRGADGTDGGEPMPARRAIAESVRTRLRPILMTTLTTVGGLAPLVFMPGAGSELYRGLGAVVLGGLLVSTIFTLLLVPALFSLVQDGLTALGAGSAEATSPAARLALGEK